MEDLRTHFLTKRGTVKAVDGVSLEVASGEVLGLVGESGCGKTMTGFSIIGLVDPPGRIVSGAVRFKGEDLAKAGAERLRALRGDRIAMIFQDPMMTLNPVLRVDTQMVEAVQAHRAVDRSAALALAREALVQVGMPAPERRLKAYPHELSGGMRQRIAIAIAFLNKPDLIIADEPTTALDVTIQAQILHEVQGLCRQDGHGHDLDHARSRRRLGPGGPDRRHVRRPHRRDRPHGGCHRPAAPSLHARPDRLGAEPQPGAAPGSRRSPACPPRWPICRPDAPSAPAASGRASAAASSPR